MKAALSQSKLSQAPAELESNVDVDAFPTGSLKVFHLHTSWVVIRAGAFWYAACQQYWVRSDGVQSGAPTGYHDP